MIGNRSSTVIGNVLTGQTQTSCKSASMRAVHPATAPSTTTEYEKVQCYERCSSGLFYVQKIRQHLQKGNPMPKNRKYLTVSELQVDDRVIPMTTNPCDRKIYTVSDLHPCNLNSSGEYKTVAVTLWDGNREHTSRITMFQLVERRWNN